MTGPVPGTVRLTLVSHARTAAIRAARFPADEGLDDRETRRVARAAAGLRGVHRALRDASLRTRQTANALGLSAVSDPALRDLDVGTWQGRVLTEIPPADLESWIGDPTTAPHGGESVVELIDRVADWLACRASVPGRTIAVTHPAVIRAALVTVLRSPPEVFWRIDVPPLSATLLHGRFPGGKAGGEWTLRHACLPLEELRPGQLPVER